MTRAGAHPLVSVIRGALPRPRCASAVAYLALLDRRLRRLEARAAGERPTRDPSAARRAEERALARRFLKPRLGSWDDGDESLVRGLLDRWVRPGQDVARERARALTRAARRLAAIEARPATLWFFLWELESILLESPPPGKTSPRRS